MAITAAREGGFFSILPERGSGLGTTLTLSLFHREGDRGQCKSNFVHHALDLDSIDAEWLTTFHLRIWRVPWIQETRRAAIIRLHDQILIAERTDALRIGGREDRHRARADGGGEVSQSRI